MSKSYFNQDPVKNYEIAKSIILVELIQIELTKTLVDIQFQRAWMLLSGDVDYMLQMCKSWKQAHELVEQRRVEQGNLQGHVVTCYGALSHNDCNVQLLSLFNAMGVAYQRLTQDYAVVRFICGIAALASALWSSLGSVTLNYSDTTINRAIEVEEEIEGSDRSCIGYTFS